MEASNSQMLSTAYEEASNISVDARGAGSGGAWQGKGGVGKSMVEVRGKSGRHIRLLIVKY